MKFWEDVTGESSFATAALKIYDSPDYKDFSLKATGCKKELKVREQVNRIQNSPFLA